MTHITYFLQESSLVNEVTLNSNGEDNVNANIDISNIQYLTQEMMNTNDEEGHLQFSQSAVAAMFPCIDDANPKINVTDEDALFVTGEMEEEEDDDESFATNDGSISDTSAVLDCDDDVPFESIIEIQDRERIAKVIDDYELEGELFDESDLAKWKEKEEKLVERFKNGYYRCKHKNSEVYKEICELYKPYISEANLRQLSHRFSTQHNEAMNHSVSAFAPKGKTYSKTKALEMRVAIAACVQILGYELFWQAIYEEFGLSLDDNLRTYLRKMDKDKQRKKELAQTKEGKSRRSRKRHKKLTEEHQKDMAAQKEGMTYETGAAFKTAKMNAKHKHLHKSRNPAGIPKE